MNLHKQFLTTDPFDRTIMAVIVGLILAIGGVVLLGNNIGVQVESYSPQDLGRSDATIRLRFYEPMSQASVEERLSIEPPIEGTMRWNGDRELVFEPTGKLITGQEYTVKLAAGAAAHNDTRLKEDFSFSFRVALPRVVYLSPATAQERNIYAHDLNTDEITQLTFVNYGIADYSVSPNGQLIAYTAYNEDGTSDIWLVDLTNNYSRQLTDCVNSSCGAPAWKPDGTQIAYEREEYDSVFGQTGSRRVWVVDVASAQSSLLFEDNQIIGHSPQYSPDGKRIAIFAVNLPGILIYNFEDKNRVNIESMQGVVGDFSPDGTKLVYPILVRGAIGQTFYTHMEMVDLVKLERTRVTGAPEAPLEDRMAFWSPDGQWLAVTRRYFDSRMTTGAQVYLLNADTGEEMPLVLDAAYQHGAIAWSPDGNWLVMQRFNQSQQNARPEVWVYSLTAGELKQIADNAYLPGFLP